MMCLDVILNVINDRFIFYKNFSAVPYYSDTSSLLGSVLQSIKESTWKVAFYLTFFNKWRKFLLVVEYISWKVEFWLKRRGFHVCARAG